MTLAPKMHLNYADVVKKFIFSIPWCTFIDGSWNTFVNKTKRDFPITLSS
jgi:hypothetical protein